MEKNEFLCSEESEDDDDDDDEEEDQISKRVTTQMSDIDGDDLNMQANQPLYNPVPGMCKVGLFDMFSSICIALQFIRKMEYDLTHLTQGYNLENLVSFNQSYCLTYLQKLNEDMVLFLDFKYRATLRTNSLGIIKHTRRFDDLKLAENAIKDISNIFSLSRTKAQETPYEEVNPYEHRKNKYKPKNIKTYLDLRN